MYCTCCCTLTAPTKLQHQLYVCVCVCFGVSAWISEQQHRWRTEGGLQASFASVSSVLRLLYWLVWLGFLTAFTCSRCPAVGRHSAVCCSAAWARRPKLTWQCFTLLRQRKTKPGHTRHSLPPRGHLESPADLDACFCSVRGKWSTRRKAPAQRDSNPGPSCYSEKYYMSFYSHKYIFWASA